MAVQQKVGNVGKGQWRWLIPRADRPYTHAARRASSAQTVPDTQTLGSPSQQQVSVEKHQPCLPQGPRAGAWRLAHSLRVHVFLSEQQGLHIDANGLAYSFSRYSFDLPLFLSSLC